MSVLVVLAGFAAFFTVINAAAAVARRGLPASDKCGGCGCRKFGSSIYGPDELIFVDPNPCRRGNGVGVETRR